MKHFFLRRLHGDVAPVDWAEEAWSFVEPAEIAGVVAGGAAAVRNRIEGARRTVPK